MLRRLPAAFVIDLAREVLGRGGVLGLRVRGHSMRPFLVDGARVVLGARPASALQAGSVVLALTRRGPRLHRVRALREVDGVRELLLRGDRGPEPAEWVRADQVVATLVAWPRGRQSLRRGLRALVGVLRRAA